MLEWGDRIATWLLEEQDLRGFVPGKGWAHAVAHGADALATLARSPHVGKAELNVLLDVIAERLALPVTQLFVHGEPDRLATATMALLRRDRVPIETLESWVSRLGQIARRRSSQQRSLSGERQHRGVPAGPLPPARAGPQPSRVRADLLLLLVDELRITNPGTLGVPQNLRA